MGLPLAWLSRALGTGYTWWSLPAWPTPIGTTVQVTNDTEFTNALSTLSATGGIIELNPAGTYAARTFSSNPSAMIYIVSASSSNKATISNVILGDGITNITFKWIRFNNGGSTGVLLSGQTSATTYPNVYCYGCVFEGIEIDPQHYPISVDVASGTGFTVGDTITGKTSGTVGILKNKPSANTLFIHITTVGSGGGATQAAPFVTTEGLSITGAGGTAVSTVSSSASWSNSGVYGLQNTFNAVTLQGCTFRWLNNGFKIGVGAHSGECHIYDNDFDLNYTDNCTFSRGSAATPAVTYVAFNRFTRAIGSNGDIGAPHCDTYQITNSGAGATTNWSNIHTYANVYVNGFSRGFFQGIPFHSDLTSGYYTEKAVGNVGVYYGSAGTQNFTIDRAKDCYIFGNLLARGTPGSGTGNLGRTFTSSSTGNVFSYSSYEGGGGYQASGGDYNLANTDANYETVYTGLFPLTAATHTDALTEIQTKLQPKSGGPLSLITSYVDWTNKKINQSIEPSIFKFTSQIDQTVDSTVTSEWRRNWTAGSRAVSITNGEYRIADDSAGTGATAWTSASGSITEGKWIQVRTTAPSTSATAKTVSLTVGGTVSSFVTITSPALSYTAADNGGTVRSGFSVTSSSYVKMLLAVRFRIDVYAANANVFSDSTAAFRMFTPSNGALRLYTAGSGNRFDVGSGTAAGAGMQTHLIAIDYTKNSVAEGGLVWVRDGVTLSTTTNTWPASIPSSSSWAGNAMGLFAEQDGGGVFMNGAMEFFWCDWGDASYQLPDITDPAVFAKFYKDLIGTDGSGPTGSQPKLCYYGDLTEWNAGIVNKGSLSATMYTTGGSYT